MRIQIGVMGSAGGIVPEEYKRRAYQLGVEIARRGCALITGGCPGLPYEATKGAKANGGVTIGISPGHNLDEHINKYKSPTENIDVLIYTGTGLMGREVTAINSCDIVIIVSGRSGTLGEFSIAYDEGKLIGVLEDTGGITGIIKDLVRNIQKATGSHIVYNSDPQKLIEELLAIYSSTNPLVLRV
jgi:hypothetical protein